MTMIVFRPKGTPVVVLFKFEENTPVNDATKQNYLGKQI